MTISLLSSFINYTAEQQGLSHKEKQSLLDEIEKRLALENSMAFLVLVRQTTDSIDKRNISLEPLENSMYVMNQRGEKYAPYDEYTKILVEPVKVRGDSVQGYVLFPRSVGEKCNPTVNVLYDHSFDVRLIRAKNDEGGVYEGPFIWDYSLLPNIPLDRVVAIPEPTNTIELDLDTFNDIFSLAVTFVELLVIVL